MKQVSGSHATCIQPSCSTRVAYRTLPVHFPYTFFTYLSKLKINEFGNAANAGKLLRYAFGPLVKNASDSIVTARLTQAMTRIKNFDLESPRGGRTVADALVLYITLILL